MLGRTLALAILVLAFVPTSYALNRIEGQIFDENGNPMGDMFVDLLNDVGSSIKTVRSSSVGRFTFLNLTDGVFEVRVLSSGKNYLEQTQEVTFRPSLARRSDDITYLEFHMKLDRRRLQGPPVSSPDAIFVQDIPDAAKKQYQSAIDDMERNPDKGMAGLEKSISIFPTYFDALSRLGKEYALRKQYDKAYPILLRAIDVNSRSFTSYYFLAWSFYKLNEIPAAIKAAQACTVILPNSADGHVLLGTVQRIHGDYKEAEQSLKKALTLSNGKNAQAHWQMALLLNRMDRNTEAADELEAYLKLAPPDDADKKAAQDLVGKLRNAKKT